MEEKTLNDLKKQADELVQKGDGYRTLMLNNQKVRYSGFQGVLRIPDELDVASSNGKIDKDKNIIIE